MRNSQLVLIITSGLLVLSGCGSSSSSRDERGSGPDGEAGAAGSLVEPQTGGTEQTTGGGTGTEAGGAGAEPAAGGTGNVGGGCEPWDCANIAIYQADWAPGDGDPPMPCGLAEDPCTGQFIECGTCDDSEVCGGGTPNPLTHIADDDGQPNVCGGCQSDADCPQDTVEDGMVCLGSICRDRRSCGLSIPEHCPDALFPMCDKSTPGFAACVGCTQDDHCYAGLDQPFGTCVNRMCNY